MSLVRISRELQERVQTALESPYRFETCERFAMRQLLRPGAAGALADAVYVDVAAHALRRRAPGTTSRLESAQRYGIASSA